MISVRSGFLLLLASAILSSCASMKSAGNAVGNSVMAAGNTVVSAGASVGSTVLDAGAAVGSKVVDAGSAVGSTVLDAGTAVGSTVLNAGVTVGSSVLNAGTTVGSTVLAAGENMTSTMSQANTVVGETAVATVDTATSTVGSGMNYSAVTVGELTGITTLVKAGMQMTPRQSYYMGRVCAAKVLANQDVVQSKELDTYVNTLGKYLAMHSQSPQIYKGYQFVVLENQNPNALSTPGGFVFITTGMIALAQTEDELAAVLAHEIAHISLLHAEEAIQTANRLDLFGGALFKTAGYVTNFATEKTGLEKIKLLEDLKVLKVLKIFDAVTDVVLNTAFNQPQELEADHEAINILRNAGYSPTALVDMIGKMADDTSFVGLHPGGAERVRTVKKELQTRMIASTEKSEQTASKSLARFLHNKGLLKPIDTIDDRY